MASTVFCASALALSACGGGDDSNTGASAPATSGAPVATTGAPATSEARAAAAAAAASDKEICDAAVRATTAFTKKLTETLQAGKEFSNADVQAAWTAMATELAVAEGGDSAVAKAAQTLTAELKTAAAAPDPTVAEESPAYQKAGADLDAACKAVGVDINFS
ncbi:hypothetical protein J2S43_002619 [Catenuloplanes nepalensis]|uniref:Lipoprotein n=1 Tax=Catenuloplanes nepalensis TaxID=587533 RepID=A0ABT9MRP7_9ACTN|nr:hypothetical protein [Catenuloplanes nepalensis]MDP9794107.1 hypothetical protein [Catenuloplanes nepalensis]